MLHLPPDHVGLTCCSLSDAPIVAVPGTAVGTPERLAAAVPNGLFVEYFPNPADYDSEEELYSVRYDLMREASRCFRR